MCICQSQFPNIYLSHPLVTISLFSTSVTPFPFCREVHLDPLFRIPYVSVIIFVFLWLTSLSRTISRFNHIEFDNTNTIPNCVLKRQIGSPEWYNMRRETSPIKCDNLYPLRTEYCLPFLLEISEGKLYAIYQIPL